MKQLSKAVGYGIVTILIIIMAVSFVLSLLLRFTSLTEDSLQSVILITSFAALFIGGLIAGKKGKESGWLIGGLTGLLYTIVIFSIQFLGFNQSFDIMQYLYHAGYIMIAVIGGAIGVNVSGKRA